MIPSDCHNSKRTLLVASILTVANLIILSCTAWACTDNSVFTTDAPTINVKHKVQGQNVISEIYLATQGQAWVKYSDWGKGIYLRYRIDGGRAVSLSAPGARKLAFRTTMLRKGWHQVSTTLIEMGQVRQIQNSCLYIK
jgi:hypothetical protein